jgi:hypothetical protein
LKLKCDDPLSIVAWAVQVDSLTVSKPELKARLVSALESKM